MVRVEIAILMMVCLVMSFPLFAGEPSRLHEFAQVADGGGDALWMKTSFLVVNQNLAETAFVELRFYDDSGNPMNLQVEGSTGPVYQLAIPSEGSVKLNTGGKGVYPGDALKVGSATLSANVEVGAQAFFEIYEGETLITQAAIEPMGSMSSVDIFVDYDLSNGVRTGYAVVNLSTDTPVQISIWLYPQDGSSPIWNHWFELPARGHTSAYLDEFFPSDQPFRGIARITGGGSFSVTALQAQGLLIGTLPPIRRPIYSRYGGR